MGPEKFYFYFIFQEEKVVTYVIKMTEFAKKHYF